MLCCRHQHSDWVPFFVLVLSLGCGNPGEEDSSAEKCPVVRRPTTIRRKRARSEVASQDQPSRRVTSRLGKSDNRPQDQLHLQAPKQVPQQAAKQQANQEAKQPPKCPRVAEQSASAVGTTSLSLLADAAAWLSALKEEST